jgi:hypothetical protein
VAAREDRTPEKAGPRPGSHGGTTTTSRAGHQVPVWLFEELEKSLRGFLLAAKERGNGGKCLLVWNRVC